MPLSLFPEDILKIDLPHAQLIFIDSFLEKTEANTLFNDLKNTIQWSQGEIKIFGKTVLEPRLSAWYGDEGTTYTYSGKTQNPLKWTDILRGVQSKIQNQCTELDLPHEQSRFNSVLLNYYRNGQDSMGWHSDDEKELGLNPTIASLNLGETRRFLIRSKHDKNHKTELLLTHGSLLIMSGAMQHHWQHAVPKEMKKLNPRINLTFRWIY